MSLFFRNSLFLMSGMLFFVWGGGCDTKSLPEGGQGDKVVTEFQQDTSTKQESVISPEETGQSGDFSVSVDASPSDESIVVDAVPERAVEVVPERSAPEPAGESVVPESPVQESVPEPAQEAPTPTSDDLTRVGPIATKDLSTITTTLPGATGCSGQQCSVKLYVTLPSSGAGAGARKAPYPLAIFSNGFVVNASFYASYAKRLGSWGYVVIRWDTTGESPFSSISHDALGAMVKAIIDWADAESTNSQSPLSAMVSVSSTFVMGHSRGGKASALAAQIDARIKGMFLLDPVDAPPPGGTAASAVAGMAKTKAPVALLGADKGNEGFQPCAPVAHNYAKFYSAATTKAWELVLKETGHMQFLDTRSGCLPCFACPNGTTSDATIREIAHTAMVAWAEFTIRSQDISTYLNGTWSQGWVAKQTLQTRNK